MLFFPFAGHYGEPIERQDNVQAPPPPQQKNKQVPPPPPSPKPLQELSAEDNSDLYDDLLDDEPNTVPHHREPDFSSIARDPSSLSPQAHKHVQLTPTEEEVSEEEEPDPLPQPQFQVPYLFFCLR